MRALHAGVDGQHERRIRWREDGRVVTDAELDSRARNTPKVP
jgi:hypothetical protein